ncbi:MAG: UDP-glucose/GDP-mannose dehydrogenase family protein [Actinomycetales bacterium]|nr:UDP-glucose/GDP-mannose dehydrogenase family protein [Actinomycetales bacterium]
MKISVIGTGYLGVTHAAALSSLGFDVVGIDIDSEKVSSLKKGIVPFFEPGLQELVEEELQGGRLQFTNDFSNAKDCEIHFICVGTPQRKDSLAADLQFVDSAIEMIGPVAKTNSLIVGKSTVPVGTAERLAKRLSELNPSVELAWNPEFLREGFAIEDTLRPNRLVVGVTSDQAESKLRKVYESLIAAGIPWIRADLPTSELVKVAANSFLATKISFINAMAEICEVAGGDVTVLAKAIGYDPRIGSKFLQAGIGFGGGCLPKDIRAFMARSEELGAKQSLEFLREIDSINQRARQRVIDLVRLEIGSDLKGKRIAILGAAFKPDSDDVRDSPALDIAEQIAAAGAVVTVHDPKALGNAKRRSPQLTFVDNVETCVKDASCILHLTEWKEYRDLDPVAILKRVKEPVIIDGRNALDRELWEKSGWRFRGLGRTTR